MKYNVKDLKNLKKELKIIFKKCNICEEMLHIKKFSKEKYGYRNQCRACRNKSKKLYILTCKYCKEQFESYNKNAIYCSRKCKGKWRSEYESGENSFLYGKKKPEKMVERIGIVCINCNSEFFVREKQSDRKFCCKECFNEYIKHNKIPRGSREEKYINLKICLECSCEFVAIKNKQKFCSRDCVYEWKRKNLKGENNPKYNRVAKICEECGGEYYIKPSMLNKSRFCSKACMSNWRSKHWVGENSPTWNPNITQEERENKRHIQGYDEFVDGVFKRDNYTCQQCGDNRGGNLVAHHLNGYNWDIENRINIDNGITLCEDCHKSFHKTYGYGHNTKEQFEEWNNESLQNII